MNSDEPLVHEVIRELYHYTSLAGLKGIIGSQYLRATRYDQLNDSSELNHFYDALVPAVRPFILDRINERSRVDRNLKKAIKRSGGPGLIALKDARWLIRRFYEITFDGDGDVPPFAVPFIVSFCSHRADDVYIRKNGLLSQWRAYGAATGRFALVFDVNKLEALLKEESQSYSFSFLNICDAVYNDDKLVFEDKFARLLNYIALDWTKHVFKEGPGSPDDIFIEFVKGAARFKHRAFHEEREFRIISCPMSEKLNEFFVSMGAPPARELPFKTVESDERGRPYVALLKNASKQLPIKRIIVGPHPEQRHLLKLAREVVGNAIPVHCSETPYLG